MNMKEMFKENAVQKWEFNTLVNTEGVSLPKTHFESRRKLHLELDAYGYKL